MFRELPRLKENIFDILIIGGGINGAGIARDAALRGFKVCLIDKGDFASGTSSKSSKLIHGGLRYLEHGFFKLVFESLKERSILLKTIPNLVRPLPFIIPVYKKARRNAFEISMGLKIYDALSGKKKIQPFEAIDTKKILLEIPQIEEKNLRSGFQYFDGIMNDARVVLLNILSAEKNGAQCLNYVEATDFIKTDSVISGVKAKDVLSGQKLNIHAKMTVNASGPWSDQLLKRLDPKAPAKLRLSKGIHLVFPRFIPEKALLLFSGQDERVFFCIPWENQTLVGTTDDDFLGEPDDVASDSKDIHYLLNELNSFFPKLGFSTKDIISTYAGLRPLIDQKHKKTSQISREYKIEQTAPGLISILGGKYTTYRSLAEKAVNRISRILKTHCDQECRTASIPLEVSSLAEKELSREYDIPLETALHLTRHYGDSAVKIAKISKELGIQGPLCPYHPHIKAEAVYAFMHEKAQTLDDFLSRRTSIRYSPCHGIHCLKKLSDALVELSILSEEDAVLQKKDYLESLKKEFRFLNTSGLE